MAESEIQRIEQAYARRRKRPHSFYAPSSVFMNQETERNFLRMVRHCELDPFAEARILDVGGAGGFFVRSLLKYGARSEHLYSIDLFHNKLKLGREIVPCLNLICADGANLPFADGSFDIVVQQTMFSSVVSADLRRRIGAEMLRVLKPGGAVLSYDLRLIRPGDHDMCAITRSELKRIFPECMVEVQSSGLPPILARWLAPLSYSMCQLASSLWPIKTHYWAVIARSLQARRAAA